MGIIVDTNVFIDAENGRVTLFEIEESQQDTLFLAAITVSELLAGAHLANDLEVQNYRQRFAENIIENTPILEFDKQVAFTYSKLYANAVRNTSRKKIDVHDLQIAATAITYDYPVLTSNEEDFRRIPGVKVIVPKIHNFE